MFDFTNAKRIVASIMGAAVLSSTCVLTAIAPARAAEPASAFVHPAPVVAELVIGTFARS